MGEPKRSTNGTTMWDVTKIKYKRVCLTCKKTFTTSKKARIHCDVCKPKQSKWQQ